GARDFLEKPNDPEELRDVIHGILSQEEQRQLARWSTTGTAPSRGTVITIAGGKAGIGKPSLDANHDLVIRQDSAREGALVESYAEFGGIAVMLELRVERSIADLARSEAVIDGQTIANYLARHGSGVDVLPASSEPDDWRAVQPEQLASMLHALSETH